MIDLLVLAQISWDFKGGDSMTIVAAVTETVGWVKDAMGIFMEPPAIYFVGFAVVGAAAKVGRKFVPMKR